MLLLVPEDGLSLCILFYIWCDFGRLTELLDRCEMASELLVGLICFLADLGNFQAGTILQLELCNVSSQQ